MLDFSLFSNRHPPPISKTVTLFLSFENILRLVFFSDGVVEPHTSDTNVCAKLTFGEDANFDLQLLSGYSNASKKNVPSADRSEVVSLIAIISVLDSFKCIGAVDNTCVDKGILRLVFSSDDVVDPHTSDTNVCAKLTFGADANFDLQLLSG
jgi:hypothetical protein